MRLTSSARDHLLKTFADRLNAGTIVIYAANPATNTFAERLIEVPFQSPAFHPVDDGQVVAHDLLPTSVLVTGEARWAQLVTAAGEPLADVPVRAVDDPDADAGDLLVDRTDFHRGGLCTLTRVTLSLPLQS